MKLKKVFAAGATVLVAGAALAACSSNNSSSSSSGSAKKSISWMDAAEIPTMDISKATDATSFNQLNNVEEGLYRLGKNSKVENALATSTKVSKDGKTWTFTLRDSKWSNGDKLTAKDFVYSWRRTVNPKTASQYAYLFEGIHNATQISAGKAPVNSLGIKAEGDNKLVVTLDKRIPYFKLLMGFPLFFHKTKRLLKQMVLSMVLHPRLLPSTVHSFKRAGQVLTFHGSSKRTRITGTRRMLSLTLLITVFKRHLQLLTTCTNQTSLTQLS